MLEIIMAISLAIAFPMSKNSETNTNRIQQIVLDNDPDDTGGEGGHIPPIPAIPPKK